MSDKKRSKKKSEDKKKKRKVGRPRRSDKDKPKDKKKKKDAGRPPGSKGKPKGEKEIKEKKKDKSHPGGSKKKSKLEKQPVEKSRREKAQIAEQKNLKAVLGNKPFSVKIVADISRVSDSIQDDKMHIEIMKGKAPPPRPCKDLVCRITYEETGIPTGSTFNRTRAFVEAFLEKLKTILKSKSARS